MMIMMVDWMVVMLIDTMMLMMVNWMIVLLIVTSSIMLVGILVMNDNDDGSEATIIHIMECVSTIMM